MPEHFTKSTFEAKFWCAKCYAATMHNVADGRRGSCQVCIKKREEENEARKAKVPNVLKGEQINLF